MYLIASKRIWPLYLPPLRDELFSSWFCRLSASHLVKNHTFAINYFKDYTSLWNRDIDTLYPKSIVGTLLNHTPLHSLQIEEMFLKSYESILFEKISPNSFTTGILPLGIRHRKRNNWGLMYCPKCLSESIPYYRKQWRIALNIVCSKCRIKLQDKCLLCFSPVMFHRLNYSNNQSSTLNPINLNFCVCGNDLCYVSKEISATKDELEYQLFIDQTIENGYNYLTQYSFLYFEVFYCLLRKLSTNGKNKRFKSGFEDYFQIKIDEDLKRDFSTWTIEERRKYFVKLFQLLNDTSLNLNAFFKKYNIPRTSIKNEGIMPYWFQNIAFNSK